LVLYVPIQELFEPFLIDATDEPLDPVHRDNRYLETVGAQQVAVRADVDLVERDAPAQEQRARVVANSLQSSVPAGSEAQRRPHAGEPPTGGERGTQRPPSPRLRRAKPARGRSPLAIRYPLVSRPKIPVTQANLCPGH
jgi:hypothetical protein